MSAEFLSGHRIIVALPEAPVPVLASACEVLAQERLRCWSLPVARVDELPDLRERFPHRAVLGVHGVRTDDQARAAEAAGAAFILSPVARASLVAATSVPVILGALTPTEIDAALEAGAAAVAIVPAEIQGSFLATSLVALFPGAPLIPSGNLESFQVTEWWRQGAPAVHLTRVLTDLTRANLGELRTTARGWRQTSESVL
ncbi:MAG: hypothetical protein IPM11_10435 [Micropruina sp.]|nr:hypothetical protein [Micropruina sp.]